VAPGESFAALDAYAVAGVAAIVELGVEVSSTASLISPHDCAERT
jgi:hypothetical protein